MCEQYLYLQRYTPELEENLISAVSKLPSA